jgi:hypothetical protein
MWLDEKIVVSSQRRMGWRKEGYFVVGNIYIWLIVVPVLLDEKNSFFIPKNNGTEKKHSFEKLKVYVRLLLVLVILWVVSCWMRISQ